MAEEENGRRPLRRPRIGILVVIVAALLAADVVSGLVASDDDSKPSSAPADAPKPPFKTGQPFREPPVVRSRGGGLRTTLIAENGSVEVSGVQIGNTETYATGSTPRGLLGPTLHVEPGHDIDLVLDNRLKRPEDIQRKGRPHADVPTCPPPDDPAHKGHGPPPPPDGGQITNLHYHGMHVTPTTRTFEGQKVYGDNVLLNLPPGKSHFRFHVPRNHDQGTFWYHAHRHGCTDDQVFRGLAGLLLVGDVRRTLPPRFRHVRTRTLALKDIQAVPFGGGWAIPNDHAWFRYPTQRTVNGLVNPSMTMRPGETQLWRVVNTSAALWYRVAVVDAEERGSSEPFPWDPYTVVAEDGNPATLPRRTRSTVLAPGHRIDILVRAPAAGTRELRTLPFDQGGASFSEEKLATVKVEGSRTRPVDDPGRRARLPHFPRKRGPTRHFTFSFVPRPGTHPGSSFAFINGLPFKPGRVSARPRLRTTEKWVLINRTGQWHPFHIHQDDFRVISVNGKRIAHPPGDQDVVGLPPVKDGVPGRVEILMPYQEFKGDFVFHCHILDHEDGGMMARVNVLGPRR